MPKGPSKARSARPKSEHSDVTGYPGDGLFVSERETKSAESACEAVRLFLTEGVGGSLGHDWQQRQQHITSEMQAIAHHYWEWSKYDDRVTFGEMKPHTRRLKQRLRSLDHFLSLLPKKAKLDINSQASKAAGKFPRWQITFQNANGRQPDLVGMRRDHRARKRERRSSCGEGVLCCALKPVGKDRPTAVQTILGIGPGQPWWRGICRS